MRHKILFAVFALAAIVFYSCDKEFAHVNDDGNAIKKQQKEGEVVVCPTNDPEITYILVDTNMLHYDGVVRHVTGFYVLENHVIVSGVIYVDGILVLEFMLPPNNPIDPNKIYFVHEYEIVMLSVEYPFEFYHEVLNGILTNYYEPMH
jgi:hypothetical protein